MTEEFELNQVFAELTTRHQNGDPSPDAEEKLTGVSSSSSFDPGGCRSIVTPALQLML